MTLVAALKGAGVNCHLTRAADQNILNNAAGGAGVGGYTTVNWDTERYDSSSPPMHDTATNNWKVTVPVDGKYVCFAAVQLAAAAGGTDRRCRILKNATASDGTGATEVAEGSAEPNGSKAVRIIVATELDLLAGDSLMVQCWQDSGGTIALSKTAASSPEFSVRRVGS
jgi:hypothetical protein